MGLVKNYIKLESIFQILILFLGLMLDYVNAELTPPYFNLATGRRIYATATCGVGTDVPELYCKLVGANTENDNNYFSVIQGQVCDTCDPTIPDKHHPPENAIDGKESWWQSPPLSRGMKYNEVNLTIDFGQEFHVAYIFIRMGNSPRPGLWTLEKSSDYGKTWTSWQHFSDTLTDCETYFGRDSLNPITNDNDVICTTEYSKIVPLENGEIPVMLLNNRPSANNYFNSSVLQEWTRATNVRIRLLRTKNLLGHLMSVARQDPTVTRRYFYSIKDISIGGRCMCNGHADTCDVLDPKSARRILACRCRHHTCGIQCNECCPGYEQKQWRQNTNARPFHCEPCNCFGHTTYCKYDPEVDEKGLSLDIHGNYDGGGVCQDCQHNTKGINCNQCIDKFYRPYGKYWNETDVCQPCNCGYFYSTGNCDEGTGRCQCRKEFQEPNCDSCAYGYFGYPNCRECECNLNGTEGYRCEAVSGICPCKINFAGHYCKECAKGYYNFPECKACICNPVGSVSNDCDFKTGQCTCKGNFGGNNCERCKHGYYSYPECTYCGCDVRGTEPETCDKENGKCLCREGYGGPRCDQCLPGYYNYPDCVPCNCSSPGSAASTCDFTGKCHCIGNFAGKKCEMCSAGYYSYPSCLACNCYSQGSNGISCNSEGQCTCLPNFDGKLCDSCKEGFYNFPACEECNCDPAGVIARFAGCGSVPAGELCQCKERVTGRICDQCKPLYWNLNISNSEGCESCECFLDGTIGSLDTCDSKTGQCTCKPTVQGRQCKECKDGTFELFGGSLFGCKDCGCDIGGSRNRVCEKISGQCLCHPRVTGRTCTQPLTTHYFPTLYQFQFEYEDGYSPSGAHVRYQYDEQPFPGFSGKGYAVFSNIQNEVINEVTIFKSSVYRMMIRYVNPTTANITANILITSDNPLEVDQNTKVLFKPTNRPQFLTVSGAKGMKPSPIVLDPGRYTISIKTDKNVLLDYFVLLPAAYYEASILTKKIVNPCELDNLDLCKHYRYPLVLEFKPSVDPFVADGDTLFKPTETYKDVEHLSLIEYPGFIPLITDSQRHLNYVVDVPHTGRYIVVIDYITERSFPETYLIKVKILNENGENGYATLYPCLYTTPCRQPVVDDDSREKLFFIDVTDLRAIQVYHDHEDFGQVGIISVTAIPYEQWTVDYIKPNPVCIMRDGHCVQSSFNAVPESKKVEFEFGHEHRISTKWPPYVTPESSTKLIYLDYTDSSIKIKSNLTNPGRYVILVKYYQPNHPKYNIPFRLETGKQSYEGKFEVEHCPSSTGCRALVRPEGGAWWFDIEDGFNLTLTNNRNKGIWLDYILVTPVDLYHANILDEQPFDQTQEFIEQCSQDHFYIQLNASEFCKKAVFSLTADYNNGALPCSCDYDGSTSFECDPFGGQCQCKPNVIGRQCDQCRTGFYGFPDCKHCDCPLTALCEKETGACICPPHVTGDKCDQCEPYTYGFHQIIGCEECNCNRNGVINGNLQCDILNGTCQCRPNIEGRACDQCSNGYFNFPHCQPCSCNKSGTTVDICDKTDEKCFCKKNVAGRNCNVCAPGTYYLQASNPDGCTSCYCFDKTNRCESAYLRPYNVSLLDMVSINNAFIEKNSIIFKQWGRDIDEYVVNETTIQADFSFKIGDDGLVYFGVLPNHFQNQNSFLTAYGGNLLYTLYYTTGPFGKSIYGPDIILSGNNKTLTHESYEQPANSQYFRGIVQLVETNFQTLEGKPATRGDLMDVLRDLQEIYIRANYWEQTVISQLSDPFMRLAAEDEESYHEYQELPIEKCHCPPGYKGLSCEDCAPGYYRDPPGPHGYCIPCECNGHADNCDCNSGICRDCQHFTTGDHCEKCIEGYHGNATFGTPHDCMICACPLPFDSNNFATSCEISETGNEIHCECKPGYIGARCESCGPGFYGQPDMPGEFCKPCECSGNINASEPGACDTRTGECLNCLNNTYGRACNLCAPGFYGDAIKLKDCRSCDCEESGTAECDSFTGVCKCHENVIGLRCDRCEDDHYGYESGYGCTPCDCGIASNHSQCDDHTGDCACKPGVTNRQCDRCAADHWNYTADGCIPCRCNKGYSKGFGCNSLTGQCTCLPGVIGEKCDACPHRWVLIEEQGCSACDICHHALLDVTDRLQLELAPVIDGFESLALAFFTHQKLNYFDEEANKLTPAVANLDPKGVNLNPATQEIETLDMDSKNFEKNLLYAEQNANDSCTNAGELLKDAYTVLNQSLIASKNAKDTIKEAKRLSTDDDSTDNSRIDRVIADAENMLTEIESITIDVTQAKEQHDKSRTLLRKVSEFSQPAERQQAELEALKKDIKQFVDNLKDLDKYSHEAINMSSNVDNLNRKNAEMFKLAKFDTVLNLTVDAQKSISDTENIIKNGELTCDAILMNVKELNYTLEDLHATNERVNELVNSSEYSSNDLRDLVDQATDQAINLSNTADDLREQRAHTSEDNELAIKAVTSYGDIVDAVEIAKEAVKNAKYAAGNATHMGAGIKGRAAKADADARELLANASGTLNTVQSKLEPNLDALSKKVRAISDLNAKSENILKEINDALQSRPTFSHRDTWDKAHELANAAKLDATGILEDIQPMRVQTPVDLANAKNTSKEIDVTNKGIIQATNQIKKFEDMIPDLLTNLDTLDDKQVNAEKRNNELEGDLEKLKQKIEEARRIANNIKVGVTFQPTTTLELKTPKSVPLLASSSKVSTYFNTTKENGFLLYLGNENKTSPQRGKGSDFMSLEIEGGYPVLTIDLGDGPEEIVNKKYVADGRWYQAIIDRTGNNAKLIIREQLDNGSEKLHEEERQLPGRYSVFNVDKNSRLFVGGYPADFTPPEDVRQSSFEGQIEGLKIGDEEVGLWNFVDASDNTQGATTRNTLVTQAATGYRFNGNGYVVLDAQPYNFKQRSTIHFKFKASPETKDGLMFYAGRHKHFIAVQLINGQVVFLYKLGQYTAATSTAQVFNDGQWHKVEAEREGSKGVLKVDGWPINVEDTPTTEQNLKVSDRMYIGGFPGSVNHSEVVKKNFDGCIDDVVISGTNVDLSKHLEYAGIVPGCPDKFSTVLSYAPRKFGYLKKSNVSSHNKFHITLKFKTRQSTGVIFYATNNDQSASIGLTIDNGLLVLRSMEKSINTSTHTYNDGEWHTVTATHDNSGLRMVVDDSYDYAYSSVPPNLHISFGEIYFGGLPRHYWPKKGTLSTAAYFAGCISDVTLNSQIVNFANTTDRMAGELDTCSKVIFDYDENSVKLYYPDEEHEPVEWYPPTTERPHYVPETTHYIPLIPPTEPPVRTPAPSVPKLKPTPASTTTTTTTRTTTTTTEAPRWIDQIVTTQAPIEKPSRRPPRPRPDPSQPDSICALPIEPDYDVGYNAGYRFIGAKDKKVEINQIKPANIRKQYEISLEFKAENKSGLLFYAADATHSDFIALYLNEGKIYHQFQNGPTKASLVSNMRYDDGLWHSVKFIRQQNKAILAIDGLEEVETFENNSRRLALQSPIYLGGIDAAYEDDLFAHVNLEKGTYFKGCIRRLQISNRDVEHPAVLNGVAPCSESLENGVFFGRGSGYVRLRDHFHVGTEVAITFDFKPRTQNGLLFSVHGKHAFLIIQLHNGTLVFSVKNDDKNMIEATFSADPGENFCDGKWRTVQAIKSQYVITLTVDAVSSNPAIGLTTKPSTDTTRPLFMGGHQYMHRNPRPPGLKTAESFHGCIRNLKIRDKVEDMSQEKAKGDVWVGKCPTV